MAVNETHAEATAEKYSVVGNNELMDDIVAEIGEKSDFCHNNISTKTREDWERMHEWLLNLRSRIEGFALRRAIELSKQFVPGNASKLREAVEFADRELRMATENDRHGDDLVYLVGCMREVAATCRAALAQPRRNCDVGTAEEQAERYGRYCDKFTRHGLHCEACPCCGKIPFGKCEFAWAQMPYEESEVKE